MKHLIKILLIAFISNTAAILPQNVGINQKVFSHGETLVYKVKWMFMRLGTITVKTLKNGEDPNYFKVIMEVESNPTLFFLSVKEYNETLIDARNFMSKGYFGDHQDGKKRLTIKSAYDENTKTAVYTSFDAVNNVQIKSDTFYNSPRYVDGPSLFFFTRVNSSFSKIIKVPTLVDGKISDTKLVFTNEKEETEIDALSYPIRTRHYLGYADWKGGTSQGLGGEFEGWISDDEAAVPVYAELKVFLGSIKLELEYWKREGWIMNFISTLNK
jgi:hypothetical protein